MVKDLKRQAIEAVKKKPLMPEQEWFNLVIAFKVLNLFSTQAVLRAAGRAVVFAAVFLTLAT